VGERHGHGEAAQHPVASGTRPRSHVHEYAVRDGLRAGVHRDRFAEMSVGGVDAERSVRPSSVSPSRVAPSRKHPEHRGYAAGPSLPRFAATSAQGVRDGTLPVRAGCRARRGARRSGCHIDYTAPAVPVIARPLGVSPEKMYTTCAVRVPRHRYVGHDCSVGVQSRPRADHR
jgi:hypothetical protein